MAQKFEFPILSFFLTIDFLDRIWDFLTVCFQFMTVVLFLQRCDFVKWSVSRFTQRIRKNWRSNQFQFIAIQFCQWLVHASKGSFGTGRSYLGRLFAILNLEKKCISHVIYLSNKNKILWKEKVMKFPQNLFLEHWHAEFLLSEILKFFR